MPTRSFDVNMPVRTEQMALEMKKLTLLTRFADIVIDAHLLRDEWIAGALMVCLMSLIK